MDQKLMIPTLADTRALDNTTRHVPGVLAYLVARDEEAGAADALISQGPLGDCTEGLPTSCVFGGLISKGLGLPFA